MNSRTFLKKLIDVKSVIYKVRHNSANELNTYKMLLDEYKIVSKLVLQGSAYTLVELLDAVKKYDADNNTTHTHLIKTIEDEITEDNKAKAIANSKPTVSNKSNEEDLDNPELAFKKMAKYVNMVIKGINPSVIICGAPGVGKTYNVMKQLMIHGYKEGVNLYTIRGRCTARKLYSTMYEYRKKGDILVIDDADMLVGPHASEDCINILKSALDSTTFDPEGRSVMYGIGGRLLDDEGNQIPKKMYYNGSMIIITNYNAGSLDGALKGRSFIQDLKFTTEQLLEIVKKIMPAIDPEHISSRSKIKAYDYLTKIARDGDDMEISIRTFAMCAKLFETSLNDPDFDDQMIYKMISDQMRLQSRKITNRKNMKY